MHIPLPKSGDLQSLEAFRDGLKELKEDYERCMRSIFEDGGTFLELRPFKGTLEHCGKFTVNLYTRSDLCICSFYWQINGWCQKAFSDERSRGPGTEGLDWREGAVQLLETIASELQIIPALAAARIQKIQIAVEGLDQNSKTLRESLRDE